MEIANGFVAVADDDDDNQLFISIETGLISSSYDPRKTPVQLFHHKFER